MRHGLLLWLVGLKIDWDCPMPPCIMDSHDQWEFQLFFRPQWQSLCKGTVKESTVVSHRRLLHNSLTDSMQSFSLRCLSPHSLIKPRKYKRTIIETVLLARNYKIKQSNKTNEANFAHHITMVSLTDSMHSFSLGCLFPQSLITQRKCQITVINPVLLARNYD